jgi:cell division protein FtsZ
MIEQAKAFVNQEEQEKMLRVKIIGVGGAGCNAVDRLKMDHLERVHLAVVTTDWKTLNASPLEEKIIIGRAITGGLSAGGEAALGAKAAEADAEALRRMVVDTDLVFILAGLGGGTGSGAAPVIARIAEESGAVAMAFVTMPFTREGLRRREQANEALAVLRQNCHAVIPLPNDLLAQEVPEGESLMGALAKADEWIGRGVRAVSNLLFQQGLINVDFATLRNTFRHRGGKTLFGFGSGGGSDPVEEALANLRLCPLLHLPENQYNRRADTLMLNIEGGPELGMSQVNAILDAVTETFCSRDNTVLGAVINDDLRGQIRITIIGSSDLGGANRKRPAASVQAAHTPAAPVSSHVPPKHPGRDRLSAHDARRGAHQNPNQIELDFPGEEENRGFFDKTEKNLHDGEDLDIPSYLRRGIKIPL